MEQIKVINVEDNMTTKEMYKIIMLTLIVNDEVNIICENPLSLTTRFTDEDETVTFSVQGGSAKVSPSSDIWAEESSMEEEDSPADTESEERREREFDAKEKRYLERKKK